MSIMAGRHITS